MDNLYLIAEASGFTFALPASDVDNVVREMDIVPVPLADPSVAGIAALRSRVVTVIDLMAAITAEPAGACLEKPVIVTKLDGYLYGFAVDRVHDILAANGARKPVEAAMSPGWRQASSGFVDTEIGAVVIVEPRRLLSAQAKAA